VDASGSGCFGNQVELLESARNKPLHARGSYCWQATNVNAKSRETNLAVLEVNLDRKNARTVEIPVALPWRGSPFTKSTNVNFTIVIRQCHLDASEALGRVEGSAVKPWKERPAGNVSRGELETRKTKELIGHADPQGLLQCPGVPHCSKISRLSKLTVEVHRINRGSTSSSAITEFEKPVPIAAVRLNRMHSNHRACLRLLRAGMAIPSVIKWWS
jgi:hypothetical protein